MANTTNIGNAFLLLVLLIAGIVAITIKVKKSTRTIPVQIQHTIKDIEVNGMKYSPTMRSIRLSIQKLQDDNILTLTLVKGILPNPILGQTSITINETGKIEAKIVLDVDDALLAGDQVEPLLGHELKHVWDALFLYDKNPYASVGKFIETANEQKRTLYRDREVESSAINTEDLIRKELINSKSPNFALLPNSRSQADVLYNNKVKLNPSLTSIVNQ